MAPEIAVRESAEMVNGLAALEGKSRELAACLRAMTLIGSSLDLSEVLDRAITSAADVMHAEAASVMLLDNETGELFFTQATGKASDAVKKIRIPRGEGIAGYVAESGEPVVVEDARRDPRFFRSADDTTGFVTRSILAVPLRVTGRIIGVAEAINKKTGGFTSLDLPLFSAYASLAAVAIENARMHEAIIAQEVIAREIEIARQIQEGLQGPQSAALGGYRFYANTSPARSVGGDFYDWIDLGGGRALMAIGDVSGKGIPAALFMANALSLLRAEAARLSEPHEILNVLNRALVPTAQRGMFVTMLIAVLEPGNVMRFATAGHHMPLILSNGEFRKYKAMAGPPLTIVPGIVYETSELRIEDGELVVLFTDGVTEATSPLGEFFEYERLKENILLGRNEPALLPGRVRRAVLEFEASSDQTDDVTIAVLACGGRNASIDLDFSLLTPGDLAGIRSNFENFLIEWQVEEKVRTALLLAMDEACTNIIRHAYSGEGGPASIRCRIENGELGIELIDKGCGYIPRFPPSSDGGEVELKPGGLGLPILKTVMDDIHYASCASGGCSLVMRKKLAAP